ncbi:ArsR/SmtB family transcription factor [Ilumatobacter sp.]|uniref:ArsR/SmtB family transcription factor n=1 Tax=Ilumatobacter sp. TaxID=1967498 RepID=UPI003AF97EF4
MNATTATAHVADRVDATDDAIDALAAALADPTRRGLLRLVRHDERSAGALAEAFPGISRPAVSQHLRVLQHAGLVEVRPDGNRRMYRARVQALAPVSRFIDEMWDDRLRRLKRAAEQLENGGPS